MDKGDDRMKSFLEAAENTSVHIEQTGDTGMKGTLINVKDDYASLLTDKKQLIHYPYNHIKSFRITITETPRIVSVPDIGYPETFAQVLESFRMQYVKIENGEGSQKGVISNILDGVASVIVDTKDLIYFPIGQIKNISPLFKIKAVDATGDPNTPKSGNNVQQDKSGEQQQTQAETKKQNSKVSNSDSQESDGFKSDANNGKEEDVQSGGPELTRIANVSIISSAPSYLNDACRVKSKMCRVKSKKKYSRSI